LGGNSIRLVNERTKLVNERTKMLENRTNFMERRTAGVGTRNLWLVACCRVLQRRVSAPGKCSFHVQPPAFYVKIVINFFR
jgi:hypothetical protein